MAISADLPRTAIGSLERIADSDILAGPSSPIQLVQLITAALFLAPVPVGGTVSGFLIVSEKEHNLIRAYQISPMGLSSYIGARSVLASVTGLASMTVLCLLFGMAGKLGSLILILLCSLPLFGVITILFGSMAKDKLSCIAIFKILMVIFLVLPLASTFVPARFHGVFYPLPMYWQFQTVLHLLNGSLDIQYCGATFVSGMILLTLVTLNFYNKTQKGQGGNSQ